MAILTQSQALSSTGGEQVAARRRKRVIADPNDQGAPRRSVRLRLTRRQTYYEPSSDSDDTSFGIHMNDEGLRTVTGGMDQQHNLQAKLEQEDAQLKSALRTVEKVLRDRRVREQGLNERSEGFQADMQGKLRDFEQRMAGLVVQIENEKSTHERQLADAFGRTREAVEEAGRLQDENNRLKQEIAGLRDNLREANDKSTNAILAYRSMREEKLRWLELGAQQRTRIEELEKELEETEDRALEIMQKHLAAYAQTTKRQRLEAYGLSTEALETSRLVSP